MPSIKLYSHISGQHGAEIEDKLHAMSTVRAEKQLLTSARRKLREQRREEMRRRDMRQLQPDPPKRELNDDQRAMRIVLVEDFFGNRELMGEAVGLGSGGLARYVQTGVASPDFDLMERTAEAIGLSIHQLRSLVHAPIYVASSDDWLDPAELSEADRLRIIRQFSDLEPDDDAAADLDDL